MQGAGSTATSSSGSPPTAALAPGLGTTIKRKTSSNSLLQGSADRAVSSIATGSVTGGNATSSPAPSPLRRETSLLSISRDPLAAPPHATAPIVTTASGPVEGTGGSTSAGEISYSPTPKPLRQHSIASNASSASVGSSAESESTSGGSPTGYRFPGSASSVTSPPLSSRAVSGSGSGSGSGSSSGLAAALPQSIATPSASNSPNSRAGSAYVTNIRPTAAFQFPSPTASSPGSVNSTAYQATSPPHSSPLAASASSPGFQHYHSGVSGGSLSRLPSLSVSSGGSASERRGTHGRSESISSNPSAASAASLSTSPSAQRCFPSAPPQAAVVSASSNASSPASAHSSTNPFSPPLAGASLASSTTSSTGSLAMSSSLSSKEAGHGSGGGGIRLQRVPTSVRLAQDLRSVMSPAAGEKRRSSVDAPMALGTSFGSKGFSLAGSGAGKSSGSGSSNSSETERKGNETLKGSLMSSNLPATPLPTRRNTPSPSQIPSDSFATSSSRRESVDSSDGSALPPRSRSQSRHLASPFHTAAAAGGLSASPSRSPTRSPKGAINLSNASEDTSSALSHLFPFSLPATSSMSAYGSSPGPPALSTSVQRSHSRSPSKGSPLLTRISPRLNQDPFDASSSTHLPFSSLADDGISPRTVVFPQGSGQASSLGAAMSESSRKGPVASGTSLSSLGIFGASPEGTATKMLEPTSTKGSGVAPTSFDTTVVAGSVQASPISARKHFRTSMMPGSAAVSSTEDYARHLQESRASKLRKWANSNASAGAATEGLSGAADMGERGTIIGSGVTGSDFSPAAAGAAAKARRRAGIPSFGESSGSFSFAAEGGPEDGLGLLGGDIGARPGTANKEIEWVDWLDEYKRMKEAKINSQRQEQERAEIRAAADQGGEAEEAEKADVPADLDVAASQHARKRSSGSGASSLHRTISRRASGDKEPDSPTGELRICLSLNLVADTGLLLYVSCRQELTQSAASLAR